MADALNQVDLAFVVDTTGSMGAFIDAARRHMIALLRALTAEAATPIDLRLGVVDHIVPEPLGGAHRSPKQAVEQLGAAIDEALRPLLGLDGSASRNQRREKFLAMGQRGL